MKVKLLATLVLLVLLSVPALMVADMSRMSAEDIVLCSLGENGIRIPQSVCKYYLYNHRDISSDINSLSSGAGLAFILSGSHGRLKEQEIARFFLKKGLDINSVNHYNPHKITALYNAVILNDVEMIRFLIKQGADVNNTNDSLNQTPLEFAQYLQQQEPKKDRTPLIALLTINK